MQVVDLECKLRRQATNPKPQASNATATPSLQLCIVLKKSPKKYMFGRLSTMKKCFSINHNRQLYFIVYSSGMPILLVEL